MGKLILIFSKLLIVSMTFSLLLFSSFNSQPNIDKMTKCITKFSPKNAHECMSNKIDNNNMCCLFSYYFLNQKQTGCVPIPNMSGYKFNEAEILKNSQSFVNQFGVGIKYEDIDCGSCEIGKLCDLNNIDYQSNPDDNSKGDVLPPCYTDWTTIPKPKSAIDCKGRLAPTGTSCCYFLYGYPLGRLPDNATTLGVCGTIKNEYKNSILSKETLDLWAKSVTAESVLDISCESSFLPKSTILITFLFLLII